MESGTRRWSGAVIGLGRVGLEYDLASTDGSRILTHAQAFHYHPRFQLVGGVDPDPARREKFTAKFGVAASPTPEALFARTEVDVVAIAVPTPLHCRVFNAIEHFPWRLLLCEKPIAARREEAQEILERVGRRLLAVNYMRRTEPGARTIRAIIRGGELGTVYKGTTWYSKGLLNNGSHFVDLLTDWLGDVTAARVVSPGRVWDGTDPEPDVVITFGETEVYFLAGREERFNVADIELVGTEGKILYGRSGTGISIWKRAPDPQNPGFVPLARDHDSIPNDAGRFQYHVLEDLAEVLDGRRTEAVSNGHTAMRTLDVVLNIFAQRSEGMDAQHKGGASWRQ